MAHVPTQSLPEELLHSAGSPLDYLTSDLSETLSKWAEPWMNNPYGEMEYADTADPDMWIEMNHKDLLIALQHPDKPLSKSFYNWWSDQAAKLGSKGSHAFMNAKTEAAAEIALDRPLEDHSLQNIQDRVSFLQSAGRDEEAKTLIQRFVTIKFKASQSAIASEYLADPLGNYNKFLEYVQLAGQSGVADRDLVAMGIQFYQLALNKVLGNVFHPKSEQIMRHWKLFAEKSHTKNAIEVDMTMENFEARKLDAFLSGHGLIFPLKVTIGGKTIEVIEPSIATAESRAYKARSMGNPQQSLKVKIYARISHSPRSHLYEVQALRALDRMFAVDSERFTYVYTPPSGDRLDTLIREHLYNFGQIRKLQEQYNELTDKFYSKTGFVNTNFKPEHVYRLSDGSFEIDNFDTIALLPLMNPSILAMARLRAESSLIIYMGELNAQNIVENLREAGADVKLMTFVQNLEHAGLYADAIQWRMHYDHVFRKQEVPSSSEPKKETLLDMKDVILTTKRARKGPVRYRDQA